MIILITDSTHAGKNVLSHSILENIIILIY